ncbi:hypothetical protein NDU88_006244 [Pleurodeles waltl]|uniref:Uncharacterized protein n=1 Tax=Pleurodeles waltl TaxID=8319 RepID=A0AAV7MCB2_PLEWA|nr:hypothetical protein NDU88_006244 [Pleurodeles waltl]
MEGGVAWRDAVSQSLGTAYELGNQSRGTRDEKRPFKSVEEESITTCKVPLDIYQIEPDTVAPTEDAPW